MIKKYNQIARIKMSKQPTTNKYIDYNFNPLFLITHNKGAPFMIKNIKDPIYGPKFRELRKLNNINIIDASKGITSKSSLDRWEKGNDNLSFSKIIELLQRIHIQPTEFLGSDIPSMLSALYQQSMIAYYNNDIDTLKKIAQKYLKLYQDFPTKKIYFFQASVACNFYDDLTNINLLPSKMRIQLNDYFSNLESWSYENILYFSCVQLLINPQLVFRKSNSLITFSKNNHLNRQDWHQIVLEAILNAIFVLLKMKQPQKSKELIDNLHTMKFNDNFILEKIRINFMSALIDYTSTKDNSHISSLLLSIQNLGLDHLYSDLKFAANQIFKLY